MNRNTHIAQLEELAAAGSWEWDVRANTLRWSPELSRIYGMRPGESPGGYEGFLRHVYPEDLEYTKHSVERALTEQRAVEYQHRIIRSDGDVRVLRSVVHVDSDDDGHVVRLSGHCQDVTERVELEERVRRLQNLASAGSIAAGLTHDLNNLIGALVLLCGSLKRGGDNGDLVDKIHQVSARTSAITSRIHRLARTSSADRRVDLVRELVRISSVFCEVMPAHIKLARDVRVDRAEVSIDPLDLERVLWNLAINARDAQPDGGVIDIAIDRVTVVGHGRDGHYYRISVRDEGVGMDEVTAARLFEPFFTTKGDCGTGIGLAVVHDIIEAAGGFVTIDTRRGGGTQVRLHLPPAD